MESIGWIDDCLLVPEVQSDSHAVTATRLSSS
jgi:hypothetical protein